MKQTLSKDNEGFELLSDMDKTKKQTRTLVLGYVSVCEWLLVIFYLTYEVAHVPEQSQATLADHQ